MAVLATDNFNRADNASLGANWTICTGTNLNASGFQIVSLHVEPASSAVDSMEVWSAVAFPNDQYAQAACTVTGTTGGTGPGVFVRGTAGNNPPCYRATVCKAASNNVEIIQQVGTTYTNIGFRTTTWVDGDILRLQVSGTTIRVYQNGVQLGADITDAVLTTGSAGIIYSSTASGSQIDNWEAGSLAGPSDDPPIGFIGRGAGW
jgi:hypothetical protein